MIIIPVTVTMIVAVITASVAIKALITDIHRLYDDTPLGFRALHFRTLELERNILFRVEIQDFPSKISLNKRVLIGL